MSLKGTFRIAAKSMFDAFGDAIEQVSYSSVGAWNPETETETVITESVRAAVNNNARVFNTEGVYIGGIELVILQNELISTPKIGDKAAFGGATYRVVKHMNLSGVVWKLTVVLV